MMFYLLLNFIGWLTKKLPNPNIAIFTFVFQKSQKKLPRKNNSSIKEVIFRNQ